MSRVMFGARSTPDHEIAVVVSAMSGKTNELVSWVKDAARGTRNGPVYDQREYDTVVASGEQVTSGLLALVLQNEGLAARSWQGWQLPVSTDGAHGAARIATIDGSRASSKASRSGAKSPWSRASRASR